MKLNSIGILTGIASVLFCANANANLLIDPYIGATIGAGAMAIFDNGKDKNTSAQSYGAAIGMDVPFVRIELEYDYMNSDNCKFHVGMINAYFKMPFTIVTPYIGGGVGNIFNGELYSVDVNRATAYQAMLGITFDIPTLPIKIDAEARGMYAPNILELANGDKPDMAHYELRAKLRYVF